MRALTAAVAAALVLLPAAPAHAANAAPTTVADTMSFRNEGVYTYAIPALANDIDPDGDPLIYTAVSPATLGNAFLSGGQLFYKPSPDNQGTDSFTYTVSDGQGNSATGTVTATLWVDPPAPADISISSPGPGSVTLTWAAAPRAVGYRILRDGRWIATSHSLSWTETGLPVDQQYEYNVVGVNGGGWGAALSDSVWWRGHRPPSTLAVDATEDPTTLSVTWNDGGLPGPWNVYRDGALLTTRPAPDLLDTGLVTGRAYSYQVQQVAPSNSREVYPPGGLSASVPGTPVVLTTIGRFFLAHGGSAGELGPITYPESAIPGGRQEGHNVGIIIQKDGQQPLTVRSGLAATYLNNRGAAGRLGFPLHEQQCRVTENLCFQAFEGGSIAGSVYGTAWIVRGAIDDAWAVTGRTEGRLGYPSSDQVASGNGIRQTFTGGTIWWSPARGAQVVSATLQGAWARSGWDGGRLGEPTGPEVALRGGRYQKFAGGYIFWSAATGAQVVVGPLRSAWGRSGSEKGPLGYPTSDEISLPDGGRYQKFQGGYVFWTASTGAWSIYGPVRTAWGRSGSQTGPLGYPVTDQIALSGGGRYQKFQGGYVFWSASTGAWTVHGPIRAVWGRTGSQNGRLGYPTSEETVTGSKHRQTFRGGTITVDVATGRSTITYR